jgi:hypothetical protein
MGKSKRIWPSDKGDIITTSYLVHTFTLSDVDDPDIYAAVPILDWERSDAGKWVMNNAYDKPSWHRQMDYNTYGYRYQIRADLSPEQVTFFELKFK